LFEATARAFIPLLVAVLALATSASAQSYAVRVVEPGDSLGLIAGRYGVSVDEILVYNDLVSNVIHPGQSLRIPFIAAVGGPVEAGAQAPAGFTWHTLQAGENLSSVAGRYGISLAAMVGANPDISSLDRLPLGIDLLIPPSAGLVVKLEQGESLLELVNAYGVAPEVVVAANDLRSPFDVVPGMLVFLPGVRPDEALARLQMVREEENRYIWPLHGRLTSYYGARNLGMGTSNFHKGIDIAAPTGTPVGASRSGTVTFAGWSNQGYGNLVKVRHAGGDETWYAHFSAIAVSVGEHVSQGEIVGRVGSTGLSTGPHLHFELHVSGRALDPLGTLR